jgi:hypothetical protein
MTDQTTNPRPRKQPVAPWERRKRAHRNILYLSNEELRRFGSIRTDCGKMWRALRGAFKNRDMRGARQWVFTLGWIACAEYYRDAIESAIAEIDEEQVKALEKVRSRLVEKLRLGLLE